MLNNLKEIHSDPCYYIDIKGNIYDSDLKVLTPYINARGTYTVDLRKTLSRRKNRIDNRMPLSISRLLLEHFVRKPNSDDVVSFVDGNPLNIELSNLKWVTRKDVHAIKFSNEDVLTIRKKLSEGNSAIEVAKEFDISLGHLYRIKKGLSRK